MKTIRTTLVSTLIFLTVSMLSSLPGAAQTEEASEFNGAYKIFAVLWRGETEVEDGFREYLDQRGIPYELIIRNLDLDRKNAPPIVEEIRRVKPDLVYTWGTGSTQSIIGKVETDTPEKYIRDIPGLFVLVAYPVAANIVDTFEHTGRHATGVSFLAPIEAQLNSIMAYRPFKKIAAIYDDTSSNSRLNIELLREAVLNAGIEFLELPVPHNANGKPDPAHLPDIIKYAKNENAEVLYMGPDSFIVRHGDLYTKTAIEAELPTFTAVYAPLKNSRALFGLVTDYHTLGKLAGLQAERILVDKKNPQDVPVAQLSRFKLWINIDVAQDISVYPPMDMISIADFKISSKE